MNKIYYILALVFLAVSSCQSEKKPSLARGEQLWDELETQMQVLVNSTEKAGESSDQESKLVSPRSLDDGGRLKMIPPKDWCSGFFPGCLWLIYEYNKDQKWEELAQKYTALLADQQWNGTTHDMGFKMYCSYGNGYRLTKDSTYKQILIQSAKTLSTRFNPVVGCIRSWDHHQDQWKFPVIIDNMMNLELLFWATKATGDSLYYKIAVSHALTTMKNHFRKDYSCYHVVDYDPETGEVLHKQTHQGYSDESYWARGQAWALYGFTMVYRETGNKAFLEQAKHIASFIFSNPNMPGDLVPYWDFNAPNIPNEPRDASAAAVIASALLELKKYVPDQSDSYQKKADKILDNLSDHYRSTIGSNQGFLLEHSTGSKPANSEVDVPLIYADYYYLEAISRTQQLLD